MRPLCFLAVSMWGQAAGFPRHWRRGAGVRSFARLCPCAANSLCLRSGQPQASALSAPRREGCHFFAAHALLHAISRAARMGISGQADPISPRHCLCRSQMFERCQKRCRQRTGEGRHSGLLAGFAGVAELVDALDLGSSDESCGGSSPSARTKVGHAGSAAGFCRGF